MGLAFIPLYIRYLGIEAYGLIGLFALLQVWLSLLDMGMTPTLGREMARVAAGSHSAQSIRNLLRSIEVIALCISLLIAGGVILCANWLANSWLQMTNLSVNVVSQAISIMGLVIALRFIESIYRSSIIGLQRQVLYNIVNSTMATLRGLGAVAVLAWLSPTVQAFFLWQGILSALTIAILAGVTYATLPRANRIARFSMNALQRVRRFAGGMISIALLSVLLTQIDKILLSKLLSLQEYGYYVLASVVASGLHVMVQPITQAFYPRFCEIYACGKMNDLIEIFHRAAQLVSILAGSAAIVIILFSETFLRLWTQDYDLAARTAPLLSLLMLGNLLNVLMWVPYQTQLAHGWTGLTTKINLCAVVLLMPAILWATPRYGAEGAAWIWVILNSGYLCFSIHFMFRKILCGEKLNWYVNDLIKPLGAATFIALSLKSIWPIADSALSQFLLLSFASLLTLGSASLAARQFRKQIIALGTKIFQNLRFLA